MVNSLIAYCGAAAVGADAEGEAAMVVQRAAGDRDRRHGRHFGRRQFEREAVLLEDLLVAPAAGPVELHHDRRRILDAHLVDAVLVAVQRELAPVGSQPQAFEGIEDDIGRESGIGVGVDHEPDSTVLESPRSPFTGVKHMKNPLDSLWGTVITGLVLTVVLYFLVRKMMGA